jgi:3-hydroxyisobutyryl-CoA hydrolase
LDGQLGIYLGLTSERISGYGVYQAGIATHFVPSDRLTALEERLAHLQFSEDNPSTSQEGMQLINSCIEEFVGDADAGQSSQYDLIGKKRAVLDSVFNFNRAEEIVSALKKVEEGDHPLVKGQDGNASLAEWAKKTRETIELRSPTSVKVALEGIRQGAKMNINEIFDLDMHLASIFCVSD